MAYNKFNKLAIPRFVDDEGKDIDKLELLEVIQYGMCSSDAKRCSGISCGDCILEPKNLKEFKIWFEAIGHEYYKNKDE